MNRKFTQAELEILAVLLILIKGKTKIIIIKLW